LASSISFHIHVGDVLEIVVSDLDVKMWHLLDALQHFQATAAPLTLERVSRIGNQLQFAQNEARNDDGAVKKTALRRYPRRGRR